MVAKGPGLEKTGVTVNKWAEFTVDTRHAGKAQVHVAALDADCNAVEVITKDNKDGTYSCRYMPKKNIKHTVIVSYGGVAVPNSPFRVSGQWGVSVGLIGGRAQWPRGTVSDARLREPGFESCAALLKPWASLFALHCSSLLSCMNVYLAIDSGGYLYR